MNKKVDIEEIEKRIAFADVSWYALHNFTSDLLSEVKRLQGWEEFAAQECRNKDYYIGLLDEISKNFGVESFTSDDGSIQDSPLRAKMPELVVKLSASLKRLREGIEEIIHTKYITSMLTKEELKKLLEKENV